jgi:hypothetical protein
MDDEKIIVVEPRGIPKSAKKKRSYKKKRPVGRPPKKDKDKKPKGSPGKNHLGIPSRQKTWPTYAEARAMMRARGLKSRKEYWKWHKDYHVAFVPYRPETVYEKDWEGWNDYLGNANAFDRTGPTEWLPFWEAARWVQKLGLKSQHEWRAYARENVLPVGIPRTPEYAYKDMWNNGVAWTEWLGLEARAVVEVAVGVEETQCWALVKRAGDPHDIFHIIKNQESTIRSEAGTKYSVLVMYRYEKDLEEELWNKLETFTEEWEGSNCRRHPNVLNLIQVLNREFLVVR